MWKSDYADSWTQNDICTGTHHFSNVILFHWFIVSLWLKLPKLASKVISSNLIQQLSNEFSLSNIKAMHRILKHCFFTPYWFQCNRFFIKEHDIPIKWKWKYTISSKQHLAYSLAAHLDQFQPISRTSSNN